MDLSLTEVKERSIGIFDSGLGGLTVVKALRNISPNEDIIYFGDTGRVPYGGKSKSVILKYADQDIKFLKSMNVKMIVAACGTVSSCLEEVKCGKSVIGVVNPACFTAVNTTKNGKIGVMGTVTAIKNGAYKRQILNLNPSLTIFEQKCPLLVPLIEKGIITDSSAELREAVEIYTKPLLEKNIDTLILGCTHYPIIKNVIQKVAGEKIKLIDSGKEAAKFVKNVLKEQKISSLKKIEGEQNYFVSGDVQSFSENAKMFLGYDIHKNVKKIYTDKY